MDTPELSRLCAEGYHLPKESLFSPVSSVDQVCSFVIAANIYILIYFQVCRSKPEHGTVNVCLVR